MRRIETRERRARSRFLVPLATCGILRAALAFARALKLDISQNEHDATFCH